MPERRDVRGDKPLGCRIAPAAERRMRLQTWSVDELELPPPEEVDRLLARGVYLSLPHWHWQHDQVGEGSCVGFGASMMMAINNEMQARQQNKRPFSARYDARWLWDRAKERDPWPDTKPGDNKGTSVDAAMVVLRQLGHVRLRGRQKPGATAEERSRLQPDQAEGVAHYRWAGNIDEMRACIAARVPLTIGIDWHIAFDNPQTIKVAGRDRAIIGSPGWDASRVRGGHCVCIYGADDRAEAFAFKNSWGRRFPLCLLTYDAMAALLRGWAEVTVVTDR
jgi:hypothetical protein